MSAPTNAKTVRAIYSDFLSGNMEGVLNRHSPDVVWEFPGAPDVPFAGSGRGRECVARHFAAVFETVEPISFDVERMIAQDDAVTTFVRVKARVRATGKLYETEMANLFILRDGVVTRFQTYCDTPLPPRHSVSLKRTLRWRVAVGECLWVKDWPSHGNCGSCDRLLIMLSVIRSERGFRVRAVIDEREYRNHHCPASTIIVVQGCQHAGARWRKNVLVEGDKL